VSKRPSFTEVATGRLRFLIDDQEFAGPEVTEWPPDMPAVTRVSYHRSDVTIEVAYVVDHMGEVYVQARGRQKDDPQCGWIDLGRNTARTGYQLRHALDRQANAICSHLGLT
jgi:hypothetical protein